MATDQSPVPMSPDASGNDPSVPFAGMRWVADGTEEGGHWESRPASGPGGIPLPVGAKAAPEILAATQTVPAVGALAPAVTPTLAAASTTGTVLSALDKYGKYGELAGDIGQVASESAENQGAGRRADADANMRAISANNAAGQRAAEFNRDLPSVRANDATRGEVLNTMQNAPLTGDPRIDKFSGGGLRPSAIGPTGRAAGAELSRSSMAKLMNPLSDEYHPTPITPSQAGWGENVTAGVGTAASMLSLLEKYGKARNT